MKRSNITSVCCGIAVAALAVQSPAFARDAASMTYINGQDVGKAERELRGAGFEYADGRDGSYGYHYSYWWHSGGKDCISVESSGGQVMSTSDASKSDCHHGDGGAGTAVAAIAGAALIGALLAHKSDHHENGQHYADTQDDERYENGFSAGLHNMAYHNKHDSKAYADGYSAGVEQRTRNTRHHSGHGGYVDKAEFKDLQGMRARNMDSELSGRGFRNVDGFKSGTSAYTIWNRPQSNQCLQVTVADGKIYDIRDIGRHPKCN